MFITICR